MGSPVHWLAPALGAQMGYALSIFGEKAVLGRGKVSPGTLATAAALLNVAVAAALIGWFGLPDAPASDQVVLVGCGALIYAYLVPYLRAIEADDVSSVVPLFQSVPVLTAALSWSLGRMQGTGFTVLGLGVVSVGSAMFMLGDPRRANRPSPKAAGWMLAASGVLAARLVLLDDVTSRYGFTESAPLLAAGLALAGVAACAVRPNGVQALRELGSGPWMAIAAAQSFNLAAEGLMVAAVTAGPASMVALTIGLQPALVLGLGLLVTRFWPRLVSERSTGAATIALKVAATVVVLDGLALSAR